MKTFIADIIPKIQRFSKRLDQLTILTNHHWVSLNDITATKTVFIFRSDNQLLCSENGIVEKGQWKHLGNDSILIERQSQAFLLKHGFVDEDILALKLDGINGYAIFVNESKYGREINNLSDVIDFLSIKYLNKNSYKALKTPEYIQANGQLIVGIFSGWHYKIRIKFQDNLKGSIYLGDKSKQYFLKRGINNIEYFNNQKECIDQLYKELSKSISYS